MKLLLMAIIMSLRILAAQAQTGKLDPSFGDSGKVISNNYQGLSYCSVVQPDDKIIVGGYGIYNKGSNVLRGSLLARYNADGSSDLSFADSGRGVYILADTTSYIPTIHSIAVQPDGKIIALGQYAQKGDKIGFALMRFNSDGSPDKTFGDGGVTITKISSADISRDMALMNDGRIVVTGDLHNGLNDDDRSFIACYNPDGSLDQNFGNRGITTVILSLPEDMNAIAVTAENKIIIGGNYTVYFKNILLRYNSNGTKDSSFGTNGLAEFAFPPDLSYGKISDITITTDAKIVTAGYLSLNSGQAVIAVTQFTESGKPDSSFATNGYTYTTYNDGSAYANSVALQQDGKIVAGGYFLYGDSAVFTVVRYSANGTLDASFGTEGFENTFFFGQDIAYSVNLQSDGKIILSGNSIPEGYNYTDISRYSDESKKQIIITKIKRWIQHHNGIEWDYTPGIKTYTVQKSVTGTTWSTVYHASSSNDTHYSDPAPSTSNTTYYRLQTTRVDGAVANSNVIAITNNYLNVSISPNPANNSLLIQGLPANQKAQITVVDFTGNIKQQTVVNNSSYTLNIASLNAGNYVLKIEVNGEMVSKQFVKQ